MEASKIGKPKPKSRVNNIEEPSGQIPEVPTFGELLFSVDSPQDPAVSSVECSIDENISDVPELLSHQPKMNLGQRDSAKSSTITQPLENDEK
uniref:Candidate secreted effector n=1 Tax=Meloidogyne incognita TaxID=6306 RepID=A0A914LLM2_MELIC